MKEKKRKNKDYNSDLKYTEKKSKSLKPEKIKRIKRIKYLDEDLEDEITL